MEVSFYLNKVYMTFNIKPSEYLATTLRNNGIISVKVGCNESTCGSCTVLVDDKPMMSCSLLTASMQDKHITTIEGIQEEAALLAKYFGKEGADQCGFCNAGIALAVHALRIENPNPSDEEIKHYLVGHLCRCSGFQSQVIAVRKFLEEAKNNG